MLSRYAPYHFDAAASVYNSRVDEVSHRSDRKNARQLKLSKNCNHIPMSFLASVLKRTWWWGRVTPAARSISRRKKARPKVAMEQQKFNRAINDCSSRNVTDLFCANWWIRVWHLWIFSEGNQKSCLTESNSIPANWRVVWGPNVFSCAIGTPRKSHILKKLQRSALHLSWLCTINKKSSKICKIADTFKWWMLATLRKY